MKPGEAETKSKQCKRQTAVLLKSRNISALIDWVRADRGAYRSLLSFLYDRDELLRWRAIEGLAKVARLKAADDLESIRQLLRNLLWSMNDESGGVGWHAPEAMGEILRNVPVLLDEFGLILGSFLREEPFERGAHYALARITHLNPELFAGLRADLVSSLNNPDQYIRGYALSALKGIGSSSFIAWATPLLNDHAEFSAYDWTTGEMKTLRVSEIARQLLKT